MTIVRIIIVGIVAALFWVSTMSAWAAGPDRVEGRYASIVVDADTLDIVHARQVDALRYPASLTKVMTLALTFDAIKAGEIAPQTSMTVSRFAAKTPPGKLGLAAGETITVENAIKAVAVRSSNDMAVVLAETIAGDIDSFAERMTTKARSIGMQRTTFKNPHGLPHIDQITTARDMAKLANHILDYYPEFYHYFGLESFVYKGRTYRNTNTLLPWLSGVDGFKTGYTRASGYNLVISAKRDGRRLIAVVLGGATGKSRDRHMQDLIERSFGVIGVTAVHSQKPKIPVVKREAIPKKINPIVASARTTSAKTTSPRAPAALRLRGRNAKPVTITMGSRNLTVQSAELDHSWSIQVGAFGSKTDAQDQLAAVKAVVNAGNLRIAPLQRGPQTLYRARLTGFGFDAAHSHCRALSALKTGCFVVAPKG